MKHLSEEELIAQAYGEGDTAAVKQHLEGCAECSNTYAGLESDLAEMKFREPPDRDVLYGQKVWASLSGLLHPYESGKWNWLRGGRWRRLSYAAACALLVGCAFIGGRLWERKQAQMSAQVNEKINAKTSLQKKQPQVAHVPQPGRVVVVVLSDHLDRSERLLVELKHADAESIQMASPLRDEARSLLAANRICRQNARQQDDPALANALDRLDHLLEELSNQPGGLNVATLARLQNEANADGLLFEVRVLRSRLPNQQAPTAGHTKGGTI
jgi:hypothetical protein